MKKNLKTAVVVMSTLLAFTLINNIAFSTDIKQFKVAVVNVQQVVANSKQVAKLKSERTKKVQELAAFVSDAKKEIAAQKSKFKQQKLEEKYNKELNVKKKAIDKDYSQKLSKIDENISSIISKEAKKGNYSMVLSKGIVLFGGDDITSVVAKKVK